MSRGAASPLPLHIPRPGPQRRKNVPVQADEVVLPAFEPVHFTALVRQHNWPPCFEPQMQRTRELQWSEVSTINRERRLALGDTGTIVGLSKRADELRRQRVLSHRSVR